MTSEPMTDALPALPKPWHVEYDDVAHEEVPCYSDMQMRNFALAAVEAARLRGEAAQPVAGDVLRELEKFPAFNPNSYGTMESSDDGRWYMRESVEAAVASAGVQPVAVAGDVAEALNTIRSLRPLLTDQFNRELLDKAVNALSAAPPAGDAVTEALLWLRACLDCKTYAWDADQREAAEQAYAAALAQDRAVQESQP